jgi:hypothetical protein
MPTLHQLAVAADNSRSAAYDIVLLAHVLSALVGFGAVVVAGGFALILSRSGTGSEAVRRYYRPGVNWAGRILFLVPVFGVALVAMSHGEWSFSDGPAERRLQSAVVDGAPAEDVRASCYGVAAMAAVAFCVLIGASAIMVAKP